MERDVGRVCEVLAGLGDVDVLEAPTSHLPKTRRA